MIPKRYTSGVAVLIATGPSLTAEQVELCRPLRYADQISVMGCNDAYRICPFLDVLYAADGKWIDCHHKKIRSAPRQPPWRGTTFWTANEKASVDYPEWHLVPIKVKPGLSIEMDHIHHGNHSGYQLINLAYLMGCRTIILIGYDCRSGGQHFFGQHEWEPLRVQSAFEKWAKGYDSIAEQAPALGLHIFNATPNSGITAFPTVDLAAATELISAMKERGHANSG